MILDQVGNPRLEVESGAPTRCVVKAEQNASQAGTSSRGNDTGHADIRCFNAAGLRLGAMTFAYFGKPRNTLQRATGQAGTADPSIRPSSGSGDQVEALKVGDLTICIVTNVNSSLAQVKPGDLPGIIRGSGGTRATAGEHLTRIVDFDNDGKRFMAVRLGGT